MRFNKFLTRLILGMAGLLFLLASGVAILISLTEKDLAFQWDRVGVTTFFEVFNAPIKLLAGSLAVFLAGLTLLRMEQTTNQIQILDDNNRFNNYYKHIEEFHKLMVTLPLIEEIAKATQLDSKIFTLQLHKRYYANSYEHFCPQLMDEALTEISIFFETLSTSPVVKKGTKIEELGPALPELTNTVDPWLKVLFEPLINKLSPLTTFKLPFEQLPHSIKADFQLWKLLNLLYWTESMYRFLLGFQGLEQPSPQDFEENFHFFQSQLNKNFKSFSP